MSQAATLEMENEVAVLHKLETLLSRKSQHNYLYEFTESVVELLEIIKELKKLVHKRLGIKRI